MTVAMITLNNFMSIPKDLLEQGFDIFQTGTLKYIPNV